MLSDNGDTTICFTINQSKFLLSTYYKYKECDTILSMTNQQIDNLSSVLYYKDSIIEIKQNQLDTLKYTFNEVTLLYKQQIDIQSQTITKTRRKLLLVSIVSAALITTALIF